MISVKEARQLVKDNTSVLNTVEISFLDARGMALARSISSDMNIPPLDNSAMDGYAVRSADQEAATKNKPATLKVVGEIQAGRVFPGKIKKGEALRIMTGAPIPRGADAVVRQEDTESNGIEVSIFVPVKKGDNLRYAGEDVIKGEKVGRVGDLLTPARLGVIASAGPAKVMVYRRPIAAVLATGDEVIEAGIKPGPGQIRSSNSYTVYHQMAEFGAIPINLGIAKDNKRAITSRIKKAMKTADLLVTSGGISVGKYDFVGEALSALGFRTIFYKVKQRPGQPMAFGKIGKMLVFALPGNPVSSMVCALQYVRPAIRKMMGFTELDLPEMEASIDEDLSLKENRTYFLRAALSNDNGQFRVRTTGPQGSGILQSMAHANALVVIPPDRPKVKRGERVRVQLLEGSPWASLR